VILAIPSIPDAMAEGQGGGFPIATTIATVLSGEIIAGITLGEVYLAVILASVFVCTLAIQGAASRLMFSMGRDHHLPGGRLWGHVNARFQTPANAVIAVGVLAALPILVIGPLGGFFLSIAATGLIYLAYWLCNVGVFSARLRGWPHQKAWFNLGGLGLPINLLALVYGGIMIVNIGLWTDPGLFGDFGGDGRGYTNPFVNTFLKPFGQELSWMPAWPTFETIIGVIVVVGVVYYLVAVRGSAHDVESADPSTGEALIG
jgi:amino acid transporter